ncbi:protachykinin-1 isoform X3 [Syngnathoides biaculeatus]|uniref:protachykinin-1 isoform X3 n=1 Tax=Syngnathoides biaculeatus TaxID=300417 RepID=UPI002ADD853A|nr:protachykinin-1 isoform X3 [Syngnathoides biaculeatus]
MCIEDCNFEKREENHLTELWCIVRGEATVLHCHFLPDQPDQDVCKDGWMSSDPFREMLLRRTRKPRPHQFISLMGKRSMAKTQIPRKRHKVNSFVGLMGKRNQEEPDSYD